MTGYRSNFHRIVSVAFVLGAAMYSLNVSAQASDASPAIRAARLTYVQGTVMVNQSGNSESVPAQLNLPLLSGVQLVTAQDGQAEVEFEDGSVVRLTPNSALSLDHLAIEPNGIFATNLTLLRGLAYCELRATPQYHYALTAGSDTLSPVENVIVRVDLDEPPAIFSVLDGTAHVEGQGPPSSGTPGSGYQADVRAGESLSADPANPNRYFLNQVISTDSWDQWNQDLDQAAANESSSTTNVRNNYAGAQGYGWSDLDADGTWYDVPGQGSVWQPAIAVEDSGFDPYGYGGWVSYPGTGYFWASGYAWGWTPYRCGSWSFFGGFGWGWAPGASCGGFGWGLAAGGRPVNIGLAPVGYRPIRVPRPGYGLGRPWIAVHISGASQPAAILGSGQHGPRQIAGVTATPIRPIPAAFDSGGTAGSSLERDFPVDATTHAPVLGIASTRPVVVHTTAESTGDRRIRGLAPEATQSDLQNSGRPSAPEIRPSQSSPQVQRPLPQGLPVQRSSPAPTQVHPAYSAPPSQPRPTYSQPPSPPHSSPPPPPSSPSSHAHK